MRGLSKKHSTHLAIALIAGILSLFTFTSLALAWGETQVYLEKLDSEPDTLVVDLIVQDVSELYGVEFRLKYDPAILAVADAQPDTEGVQIEPGRLLPADQGFVVVNEVNPQEGVVIFAMTLLNPAPPVNGTGNLGRITFNVLQDAPTTIEVTQADLVSSNIELIPTEATGLQIGGSDFPWWAVGAGVIILGIIAAGAALWLINRGKLQPAAPQVAHQHATPRQAAVAAHRASAKGQPLSGEPTPKSPSVK